MKFKRRVKGEDVPIDKLGVERSVLRNRAVQANPDLFSLKALVQTTPRMLMSHDGMTRLALARIQAAMNEYGCAMQSPGLEEGVRELYIRDATRKAFYETGVTCIRHLTRKRKKQLRAAMKRQGVIASDAIEDAIEDGEKRLHGVGLDFASRDKARKRRAQH